MIVTGVRAYERRADLRAYNRRLLDYVSRGGTVIVQYNKMEFNQAEYGPYPAKVSGNRVSDELVPVKMLAPADPVFNFPNKIGPATWAGWVQERGLYFLGEKDPKYIDLVSMTDSFKDNPGEKLGSMVEAKYGKGRWIYLGLGLWRQLPAGTDGAYQLLANLITSSQHLARRANVLRVAQQRLEAVIHVLLDMAVEQRQSRLVGGEVDAGASVGGHHDRVLDHARRGLAIDLGDLELVAMQMQRMRVVGAVVKRQPVARALLEHELLIVRIRLCRSR